MKGLCGLNSKFKDILEIIKTVTVAVLFLTVVILSIVYIALLNPVSGRKSEVPFDKLWTMQDHSSYSMINPAHLLPEFIGVRYNEEYSAGIIGNTSIISEVYNYLSETVYNILGDNVTFEKVDEEEKNDVIDKCMTSERYIYIKYGNSIPRHIIHSFAGASFQNHTYTRSEDNLFNVSVLFLVFNSDELYTIAITDKNEIWKIKYSSLSWLDDWTEFQSFFDIYATNFVEFSLAGESFNKENYMGMSPFQYIIDSSIYPKQIMATRDSANLILMNEKDFSSILYLFDFNPNKLSSHEEADSSVVFVESHGVLKLSNNSIIYTAQANGGLPLSDYASYRKVSEYDIYDIMEVTEEFISTISNINVHYLGGKGNINIGGVYREGQDIIVEYKYYYDNIEIDLGDADCALRFRIKGDKITGVEINTLSVYSASQKIQSISQKILYTDKKLNDSYQNKNYITSKNSEMKLIYPVYNNDVLISSEWIIKN